MEQPRMTCVGKQQPQFGPRSWSGGCRIRSWSGKQKNLPKPSTFDPSWAEFFLSLLLPVVVRSKSKILISLHWENTTSLIMLLNAQNSVHTEMLHAQDYAVRTELPQNDNEFCCHSGIPHGTQDRVHASFARYDKKIPREMPGTRFTKRTRQNTENWLFDF